jgi:hypothetical protein
VLLLALRWFDPLPFSISVVSLATSMYEKAAALDRGLNVCGALGFRIVVPVLANNATRLGVGR